MKPDAFVINVARGGVIDEAALAAALERRHHRRRCGRRLLVEPPAPDNPSRGAPNIILTPHLGASTAEAQTRVAVEAAEQVREVLAGRSARYAVNAPMLTPETADALAPYLPLARTLGQFYAQFVRDVAGLTLEVAGELSKFDTAPLVAAALGGILETAHRGARQRHQRPGPGQGPRHDASSVHKTPDAGRFSSLLTLKGEERSVAGTVSTGDEPRLVALDGYEVDLAPGAQHARLAPPGPARHDRQRRARRWAKPTSTSATCTSAARTTRSIALMVLALDEPVPETVADQVRAFDGMLDVWLINLDLPA